MKKPNPTKEKIGRIDIDKDLRLKILPYCRLRLGEIWEDPVKGHRVGVIDAADGIDLDKLTEGKKSSLSINDPPYNIAVGSANTPGLFKTDIDSYIEFSKKWISNIASRLADNAHLYIWTGCDLKDGFQPLPDLMILMRSMSGLKPRNFITMRNQRGYGTQKNWMWVRQELLHYIKGDPAFKVVYTDIPKILKGYYKTVEGKMTENIERSRSVTIRPGNVWVDIQQVFYRMEENVPGCYAQKPLKAIERLICSSSGENGLVTDLFAHSGTTLLAGEISNRRVCTADIDPVFAEITIRRLENFRKTGKKGWQWNSPFPEIN